MLRAGVLAATLVLAGADVPALTLDVDVESGDYSVLVDGVAWFSSAAAPSVCVGGEDVPLAFSSAAAVDGVDAFGPWTGVDVTFAAGNASRVVHTFKTYIGRSQPLAVLTAAYPDGLDTAGCGDNWHTRMAFPQLDTAAARAPELGILSWHSLGNVLGRGLGNAGQNGQDFGPIVAVDGSDSNTGRVLVMSTLDYHKISAQNNDGRVWSMGPAAAIPVIPPAFNHSTVLSASYGGVTAAVYAWGAQLQAYYGTHRVRSVLLDQISYFTDDGAYYYCWTGYNCTRPASAADTLLEVKQSLWTAGVPIAALQLDDWYYRGPFTRFSWMSPSAPPTNVRAVESWLADTDPRLFPQGLAPFASALHLSLALYVPFFSPNFTSPYRFDYPYNTSCFFNMTKLVVPEDSYPFWRDLFQLGWDQTGGPFAHFRDFELDFMDFSFGSYPSLFASVDATDTWFAGLHAAAAEKGVSLSFCLASPTDFLLALQLPAVTQARASGDNVGGRGNAQGMGLNSLLLGALALAPSKDTLWTSSPQPPTWSDAFPAGDYTTQGHVQLDVVLAALSLGPVGISDAINHTDVGLISQTFMSHIDGTLLRPARPLSWTSSALAQLALGQATVDSLQDVRTTYAAVPATAGNGTRTGTVNGASDPPGPEVRTHLVVAWSTNASVQLAQQDLFPTPPPGAALAVRAHVPLPAGAALQAGCVDGQPAEPDCVTILPGGQLPLLPPTGDGEAAFSYLTLYEPLPNGAYLLGELAKLVHVAPQRFAFVLAGPQLAQAAEAGVALGAVPGPAGIVARVRGTPGQSVLVTAVDPQGLVRVANATLPEDGVVDVGL